MRINPDGASLIAKERQRQIEVEGWTRESDLEKYKDGDDLAQAAACYCVYKQYVAPTSLEDVIDTDEIALVWPWDAKFYKPCDDRIKQLTKAGALIAAAIDVELARAKSLPSAKL